MRLIVPTNMKGEAMPRNENAELNNLMWGKPVAVCGLIVCPKRKCDDIHDCGKDKAMCALKQWVPETMVSGS